MRITRLVLLVLGICLAVTVLSGEGRHGLIVTFYAVGWAFIPIAAFELLPLTVKSIGWRLLIMSACYGGKNPITNPTLRDVVEARWVRQTVSQLLPVARVGGDLAGARVLILKQIPVQLAGAASVVDLTIAATSQSLFTILGVLIWWQLDPGNSWVWPVLLSAVALLLGLAGFAYVQQRALFARLANRGHRISAGLTDLVGGAQALDQQTRQLYARRTPIVQNLTLQLSAQALAAGEVWLIGWIIDAPVSIAAAIVVQSVSVGLRAAAFFVPGGLGVQEGSIVLLTEALGLGTATGITIALVKRAREICIGAPALVLWHRLETARGQ